VRLSVASPEDLTEPRLAERLMKQVTGHLPGQENKARGSQGSQGTSFKCRATATRTKSAFFFFSFLSPPLVILKIGSHVLLG
jgi:hypothetical protein